MGYTQQAGNFAEDLACDFLKQKGLQLIERNYRCRFGEIDLVMKQEQTLVFIEVRSRQKNNQVDAITSIDLFKQQKLIRSAEYYLQQHKFACSIPARFDVIAVTRTDKQNKIDWLQNAIEG